MNSVLNSLPENFSYKDKHESEEKHIRSAMHMETETLGMTFEFSTKTKHTLKINFKKVGREEGESTAIYIGECR